MPQENRPTPRQRRAEFDEKIHRLAAVLQEIADAEPTAEQRSVRQPDGSTHELQSFTVPLAILNALEHIGYFEEHSVQFHLMPCATGKGGAFMRVLDTTHGGRHDGRGSGVLPTVGWLRFDQHLPGDTGPAAPDGLA